MKRRFGLLYGAAAGLAFALTSWGWDALMLSRIHASLPWTTLLAGLLACALTGGLAGWLTVRFENSLLGLLFWCLPALCFAWLMVMLPLQVTPLIVSKLVPQFAPFIDYSKGLEFPFRFAVSLGWAAPFILIVGVIQLAVSETAVFSTSIFGRITPLLFCAAIIGVSGFFTDDLVNSRFRDAIGALDHSIQFVAATKDSPQVDRALARAAHASALDQVRDYVGGPYHLFVGSYDDGLGEFVVLADLDGHVVKCNVVYNQPVNCLSTP